MDSDLDVSVESDDAEELTAGDILKSMEEIWINEKFAPEILPNKMEIVDCLYLQIQEMEKNITGLEKNDIRRSVHELELIRIRFLLSSYLRTRLTKIETYARTILNQEEIRKNNEQEPYLSESETEFAQHYINSLDKYVTNILSGIPHYVPDESKDHPVKPNMHSFVFFQSKKSISGIVVDDGANGDDLVDIEEGSKMIMSYSSIENLLKHDEIKLI